MRINVKKSMDRLEGVDGDIDIVSGTDKWCVINAEVEKMQRTQRKTLKTL